MNRTRRCPSRSTITYNLRDETCSSNSFQKILEIKRKIPRPGLRDISEDMHEKMSNCNQLLRRNIVFVGNRQAESILETLKSGQHTLESCGCGAMHLKLHVTPGARDGLGELKRSAWLDQKSDYIVLLLQICDKI